MAAAHLFPGPQLVGWESGEDLAPAQVAGFAAAVLRVRVADRSRGVTRAGDGGLQHAPREADAFPVRVWLLVYGVLYVVLEMVGHQLAAVGWPHVTGLDVATALTDAFLAVAIAAAVVLTSQLGLRWWLREHAERPDVIPLRAEWDDEPIEVTAWRPTPEEVASPPAPRPPTKGTYGGSPYTFAGRRWPIDGGRQL